MTFHGTDCPCATCDDGYRQGKRIEQVNASASLFGWAFLGIVAILVAALLTGCGDSLKTQMNPHAASADEMVKQTRAQQDIAASLRRIADALDAMRGAK